MTRRERAAAQPVGTRRAAREFAFRVLFEAGQGGLDLQQVFTRSEGAMLSGDDTYVHLNPEALSFAHELTFGYQASAAEINDLLQRTIRGWSFEQMAQTDLNVLRLAVFEMQHTAEAHPPIIESAVRIARKFGGDDSGRFVNGVLGGMSRSMEAQPSGEAQH
ncbi:transcription antitermination factor NusB [Deinococcus psychrotolerans]|uniref:Transcription antitermination protein NusB n=1 Tax=Deinococcus psychrotolerans TaxID=2489213 RepID=A0A3G8YFI3_9DEIO|nr:transcription antitermination factor NusB [Deinococcus psychrotolerans]AZI43630.1 transcription antitermination factor NusB [Deinococcus psychrotolerans]